MIIEPITSTTVQVLAKSWQVLAEASPYVLFGFAMAGLIKAFIPESTISRILSRNGTRSVILASLIGVPLPLCSCSVIPVASELRSRGASRGATAAFLISTPESGVDSIAVTWSLMDPIMTLVRPLAAFFSATLCGLMINLLPESREEKVSTAAVAGST